MPEEIETPEDAVQDATDSNATARNYYRSIPDQLEAARVALTNAAERSEIATALATFGYDAARIAEGQALFEAADVANSNQVKEYGEQYAATDALESARAKADGVWSVHYSVARIAFKKDRGALTALGADHRRARKLADWLAQATQFYRNALENATFLEGFARFGQNQASLEQGRDLVKAVADARAAQKKETGEAQEATVVRDAALEDLDEWMSDFLAIARLALAEQPQLMEALGIVV